jgi:cytochrome b
MQPSQRVRDPVKVWGRVVRALHWGGVVAVTTAWVTSSRWVSWHEPAGYVVLAMVSARIAWGFTGSGHARFAGFVRGPRATWHYARQLVLRREARHLGHNPLGGWMIVALLLCMLGVCATGWLFTTDMFWGSDTVAAWHSALAWALLGLVAVHVAGVVFTSVRHRENLVASMLDGDKRAPSGDDTA